MSSINENSRPGRPGRQRARTQRRAQQRSQRRAQPVKRKGGLSTSTIIGGLITLVILAAIGAYVYSQTSKSTPAALTNASALNPNANNMPTVGQTAPNFTLKDAQGKSYSLAAQRGHPVLLEFFAVWCPICQGEAPTMAQVTKSYVPKGVRVWSVLANPYGPNYEASHGSDLTLATSKDLTWFAQNFNVKHPQLVDPQFQVTNRYGINAYPGIFVISPTGKILFAAEGHQNYNTLAKSINKALKTA